MLSSDELPILINKYSNNMRFVRLVGKIEKRSIYIFTFGFNVKKALKNGDMAMSLSSEREG